jgi:hypothetical protein
MEESKFDIDYNLFTYSQLPVKNSELIFGETHYQTSAKFNKLQKKMWKKYFGIEIKDIKGEK